MKVAQTADATIKSPTYFDLLKSKGIKDLVGGTVGGTPKFKI